MKLNEVIEQLEGIKKREGDIEVFCKIRETELENYYFRELTENKPKILGEKRLKDIKVLKVLKSFKRPGESEYKNVVVLNPYC